MLPPETVKLLQAHYWSGNVRELANVLEHSVILSDGLTIRPEDLPRSINRDVAAAVGAPQDSPTIAMVAQSPMFTSEPRTLREMEEFMILRVLDKYQGDKPKAAKELGIALKTLYNRLSQMSPQRDAG
ncbi:MAG: helix-turn-helix domain-containing protein [Planctomycetaceae bacterium]